MAVPVDVLQPVMIMLALTNMPRLRCLTFAAFLPFAMTQMPAEDTKTHVTKSSFGTADGKAVDLYTLSNGKVELAVMTRGATVVRLKTADRSGHAGDILLGFDSLAGYSPEVPYLGAIVGRYGNRIAKGRFSLDGKEYHLAVNNGENALHGGKKGFDKVIWTAMPGANSVEFTYLSKDGEEGYPGNLTAKVTYTLTGNTVRIGYTATTDKDTVQNLTNHSYFNLAGPASPDILKHQVTLYASRYTPVDAGLIPTGELAPVKGTPFDFLQPHAIGERIDAKNEQIKLGGGYDHNYVLDSKSGLGKAAEVYEPTTGRVLEVWTTQPGVQFYSGNFLDGTFQGRGATKYAKHAGLCLETQHYPDSPNHPKFPTAQLKPGETFHSTTEWRFLAR
jgi:aldose 1-epimerase